MLRGALVKLFLRLETKSLVSVNRQSDAQTGCRTTTLHAVASGFSLSIYERHPRQPGAGGEVGFEEGTLRISSPSGGGTFNDLN